MKRYIIYILIGIFIFIIIFLLSRKIKITEGKDLNNQIKNLLYQANVLPITIPVKSLINKNITDKKQYFKLSII